MSARVLIVEDERELVELMRRLLKRNFDVEVDTAGNGRKGLEKATARVYDLILSDITMPELNGVTMVQRIRAGGPNARTPVIIVTGHHAEGIAAATRLGARFVAKPYRRKTLIDAAAELLAVRETRNVS